MTDQLHAHSQLGATEKRKISCPCLESYPSRRHRIMLPFIFSFDLRIKVLEKQTLHFYGM
jgi:hypothetical protein